MDSVNDICLVTGACGFVGSHLIDALLSQGFKVRATDLESINCHYLPNSNKLEFIAANITDLQALKSVVKGVTVIFHTAGIFRFDYSHKLLNKVNVGGSTNLFEAALAEDILHVVNWSTAMIYGTLNYTPADENHPIHPEEPYSQSKWNQEMVASTYYEENCLPITSIRPTAIYGPRSIYGTARAIIALANGKIFGIPSSGETIQHHVHVKDVVDAAIFIVQNREKTIGEAYNIADEVPISIIETYRLILDYFNREIPKLHFPKWLVLVYGYLDRFWNKLLRKQSLFEKGAINLLFSDHIFDNTKLKHLGFQYSVPDFKSGISSTLHWYEENGFI